MGTSDGSRRSTRSRGRRASVSMKGSCATNGRTWTSWASPMPARSTNRRAASFPPSSSLLHTQHFLLLKRNLLYTAVTRAQAARRPGGQQESAGHGGEERGDQRPKHAPAVPHPRRLRKGDGIMTVAASARRRSGCQPRHAGRMRHRAARSAGRGTDRHPRPRPARGAAHGGRHRLPRLHRCRHATACRVPAPVPWTILPLPWATCTGGTAASRWSSFA